MAKYILFSDSTTKVLDKIVDVLFIKPQMKIAYMPSDGANTNNSKYESFWRSYVEEHCSDMVTINNSHRGFDVEKGD